MEEPLLRIGQEALLNAVRHARAEGVQIELRYEADSMVLRASDDWCGFDTESGSVGSADHYGLTTMKERAAEVGAALRVDSETNRGTVVEVVVPAGVVV